MRKEKKRDNEEVAQTALTLDTVLAAMEVTGVANS
jgi:hypothetical protein